MALSKIFTIRFYAKNTGFFLVLFYFFFGIVPGGQLPAYHHTLIKGFTGTPEFLALVCFIWSLYNLKCVAFIFNLLSSKDHTFLYGTLGLLEGMQKWRTWLWLHITIYAPVLIYGGISTIVAAKSGYYMAAVIIVVFNLVMMTAPLALYVRKMKHPGTVSFLARWQHWFNRTFRKPIWSFYGYELLNNNIRSLAISKIVTAIVIILTCSVMAGKYDERMLLVGVLICVLAQSILVYNHRRFDDLYLSLLPQLPVPVWKRYLQNCLLYLILTAPEHILIIVKTWTTGMPAHWLMLVLTGVSLMTLFRSLLYMAGIDQDRYFRWVVIAIVVVLFLGLAHLYWYSIILVQVTAWCLFRYRYYRYEAPLEKVD
ncbi:hypothetical protein [Chitinophaga rhizophila]|uniref:Uncharacterized protein n=1 Tax=Chitinophaga rhizophila TaxID=2866212 RepID=A0ABS7GAX8_9BACT|nr:hypothetical protein [Chitinophaga rhizophila]MBW8683969.1 hypothetical protein [Chitinophaga rhizophila]